ncbi:MAG: ATP synthase F0 subunit B [Deltaproteobacteria bacterium]|nr:ATP synthase F0 subunit B [Deltaproteobacteria bacterium]
MLDINQTLLFQMIGFFALLFILNRLLYKPLLKVLKEREERIDGSLKAAAKSDKDVEEGLSSYEKKIKEAALKGTEAKNKLKQEGLEREKEVIEAARASAAVELGKMQTELEKSKRAALESLKGEAVSISKNIAEKILERKLVIAVFAFILPLIPAILKAAEEGGEHGNGDNTSLMWKAINFGILAAGIVIIWKKLLRGLLEKRSDDIKKAMEEARTAKEAADKKAEEYRGKLAMLDKKVAELHKELELEGEAEKKRIMAEAEKAAAKIKEQARLSAEAELKKAKIEIREEVARIAVGMAEEILRKELKPEDQERLIKGYLDNLRLN